MTVGASQAGKLVYRFDEGDASMTDLLGGKGSNLCEMVRLGLPVPPGFVITTEACLDYFSNGRRLPAGLTERDAAPARRRDRKPAASRLFRP